jgi:hypothetical protein
MSDAIPLNLRKVSEDVQARIKEHTEKLTLLRQSVEIAKKMGEDTTDAEKFLVSLEALLDSMRKQLGVMTK